MTCDLSIIIPAYNEAALIAHGLESMRRHLQGLTYEIFVVDNGSTDDTAAVVSRFENVRLIRIPKSTISTARNRGAHEATGVLFAFLDADVMITPRWVAAVKSRIAAVRGGADYYGGFPYDIPESPSLIERAWFVASSVSRTGYVGSANLLVSASVFHKIQGFDESLVTTEDMDFGHRAIASGVRMNFDPEFVAIHLGFPKTARAFIRREMWHGSGSFRSLPAFLKSKVSVAAFLTAALLVASILLLLTGHPRAALGTLLAHLALPALYVMYRFRFHNGKYFPCQYLLGYLYLGARAISGLRSLLKLPVIGGRTAQAENSK